MCRYICYLFVCLMCRYICCLFVCLLAVYEQTRVDEMKLKANAKVHTLYIYISVGSLPSIIMCGNHDHYSMRVKFRVIH